MRIPKICIFCGKEFIAKTTVTKFCCHPCASRYYKKRKREEQINTVEPVENQRLDFQKAKLDHKEFLSIAETCQLLGASRMTIYRQIKAGNIHAAKLGRRTIIKKSSINQIFES